MRSLVVALLATASLAVPFALTACSDDEPTKGVTEDEVQTARLVAEGGKCSASKKCEIGLVCKNRPSGPPPGAVGLPLPPGSSSGGPPPGAVGLPLPPDTICQKPAPGEEGALCTADAECGRGLECQAVHTSSSSSSTGGPPPGAVGLPLPPSSSSGGPPPGAVGLPLPVQKTCQAAASSGGPPPGAVGLPLPPPSH